MLLGGVFIWIDQALEVQLLSLPSSRLQIRGSLLRVSASRSSESLEFGGETEKTVPTQKTIQIDAGPT